MIDDLLKDATDRMHKAEISPTRYPGTRAKLLARWRTTIDAGGGA